MRQLCYEVVTTNNHQRGQAAIVAAVFFTIISLVLVSAYGFLSISRLQGANELLRGAKSYANASSAAEDFIYRAVQLKNTTVVGPSERIPESGDLNGGETRVTVNANANSFALSAVGDVQDRYRKIQVAFNRVIANGVAFESALQAGFLGTELKNTISVRNSDENYSGSLFSNGTVNSSFSTSDTVYGNVSVARPIANDTYMVGQTNTFGGEQAFGPAEYKYVAQSFVARYTAFVPQVKLHMRRTAGGTAKLFDVYIVPNDPNNDRPQSLTAGTYRSVKSNHSVSVPGWTTVDFTAERPLVENEKYWIVLKFNPSTPSDYYRISVAGDSTYQHSYSCYRTDSWCNNYYGWDTAEDTSSTGSILTMKYSADGITYTAPAVRKDFAFKLYFGEATSLTSNPAILITRAEGVHALITPDGSGGRIRAHAVKRTISDKETYYKYTETGSPGVLANDASTPVSCAIPPPLVPPNPPPLPGDACQYNTEAPEPLRLGVASDAPNLTWQRVILGSLLDPLEALLPGSPLIHNGNITISGGSTYNIGPAIVNGNITMLNNDSTLILRGDDAGPGDPAYNFTGNCPLTGASTQCNIIWVKGSGDFRDGCRIRVEDSGRDGFLIFTGKVNMTNTCILQGADGNERNIYVISLHGSKPDESTVVEPNQSIRVQDNVQGGVYFAPLGEIVASNSVDVVALSAARVKFIDSGTIKYKQNLVTPSTPDPEFQYLPVFTFFGEVE